MRTAKSCGPGAPMLAPSFAGLSREVTVAKELAHRGDHEISRKAIAQGRPDALRWTCMLVCALLVHIAHETAGAARTGLPCALCLSRAGSFLANLGRFA